jgi:hypothetical protein
MKTKDGVTHLAWTCLACGFINCWTWEDDTLTSPIDMKCDNCDRTTHMELKND